MEKLKDIKGFLQQVSDAFAAVLDVELAIIDNNLEVIAGTGWYKKEVGVVYNEDCTTDRVIQSWVDSHILIEDTKQSHYCEQCDYSDKCTVVAFAMRPIFHNGEKIGTVSLLALNEDQKGILLDEFDKKLNFLNNVTSFIVTTLNEKRMRGRVTTLANQFETVINSVHEGIIALDARGDIININGSARKILSLNGDRTGKHISSVFPDFDPLLHFEEDPGSDFYEKEMTLDIDGQRELKIFCSITPIYEGEEIKGSVISFRKGEEIRKLASKLIGEEKKGTLDAIKGTSNELIEIKNRMRRVCNTDSTIFIQGETGTGKSLFAKAIHEESHRKGKPFVTVNCAAIPDSLLESELFGYDEGAFTGAKKGGKPGKFELAHEGTIFLDEIGDMPLSFQVDLLQVIETRQIERVGGVSTKEVDVRIIAATNQDLERLIEEGLFREDLFYRLNVIPFYIPPLRQRKEDINLLMHFFLDMYSTQLGKNISDFQEGTRRIFLEYPWPGNIRELENAIEYAVNIETGPEISLKSLPERLLNFRQGEEVGTIPTLDALEREAISKALQRFGFSTEGKEKAAATLGISRATLYRKLKEIQVS